MLSIPPTMRVFVAVTPTDMRKSFSGLACAQFGVDPKCPDRRPESFLSV